MEDQIKNLKSEKHQILHDIAKNNKELHELYKQLSKKKEGVDEKDERIGELESAIDDLFVECEKLEH